jgi:hypothetical protein
MAIHSTSHKAQVKARFEKAFVNTAQAYDQVNKIVINTPRYWQGFEGRTTRRRSGEIIQGAYRNIRDLANLADSQQMTLVSPFRVRYLWDGKGETPAIVVHEGARLRSGKSIPARRWTQVAAQELNLSRHFAEVFNAG